MHLLCPNLRKPGILQEKMLSAFKRFVAGPYWRLTVPRPPIGSFTPLGTCFASRGINFCI